MAVYKASYGTSNQGKWNHRQSMMVNNKIQTEEVEFKKIITCMITQLILDLPLEIILEGLLVDK